MLHLAASSPFAPAITPPRLTLRADDGSVLEMPEVTVAGRLPDPREMCPLPRFHVPPAVRVAARWLARNAWQLTLGMVAGVLTPLAVTWLAHLW